MIVSLKQAQQASEFASRNFKVDLTLPSGKVKSRPLSRFLRKSADRVYHDENNLYFEHRLGVYSFPLIEGLSVEQHYYLFQRARVSIRYTRSEVERKMREKNRELQGNHYDNVDEFAKKFDLLMAD